MDKVFVISVTKLGILKRKDTTRQGAVTAIDSIKPVSAVIQEYFDKIK